MYISLLSLSDWKSEYCHLIFTYFLTCPVLPSSYHLLLSMSSWSSSQKPASPNTKHDSCMLSNIFQTYTHGHHQLQLKSNHTVTHVPCGGLPVDIKMIIIFFIHKLIFTYALLFCSVLTNVSNKPSHRARHWIEHIKQNFIVMS